MAVFYDMFYIYIIRLLKIHVQSKNETNLKVHIKETD